MSTRDELADALGRALANAYDDDSAVTVEEPIADTLIAEGWRKKPDAAEVARALYVAENWGVDDAGKQWDDGTVREWIIERMFRNAEALLALMDRGQ